MPSRAFRACRSSGCPALVESGYCLEHEATYKRSIERWRGSPASRGYDNDWRKLRSIVLKESMFLCQHCLSKGIVTPARDVHHKQKVRLRPDLRLERSNLIAVCRECHEELETEAH
jgi:5-methylcytosine-specific restriction protein A